MRKNVLLNVSQVSKHLGVSRAIVQGWIDKGKLPCFELPGSGEGKKRFLKISAVELLRFLEKHRTGAGEKRVKANAENTTVTLLPR